MAPPTALVATATAAGHPIDHRGVKHLLDSTPGLRALPPAFIIPNIGPIAAAPPSDFPIIDVGKLMTPSSRASVVQDIASACAEGFFLVVNHNIKTSTMDGLVRAAEAFFSLPLEEKMKYASDEDMAPVRYGSSLNSNEAQPHHFWRDFLRHFGRPVIAESCHLWPTTPEDYTMLAKEFLEGSWELAMQLAGAISEGLGEETNYVEDTFGEGLQTISCNYYPPCPQPDLALGVGAHTDQGAISILIDNHADGLQMKSRDGRWVPVPHVPGALVVNLGDYLEQASQGRVKAAEHRVVLNETAGRVSVAVGNGPEMKKFGPCPPTVLRFV